MEREIFIDTVKETSLVISESKVDAVKLRDITKKAVRVYDQGVIGVAGAVGDIEIEELTEKAKENLKNDISYPFELSKDLKMTVDASKEIIKDERFIQEGEELLEALSKEHKDFTFSNKITLLERETSLSNSCNLDLKYKDRYLEIGILFKEKASLNIIDGMTAYAGRGYNRAEFMKFAASILEGHRNTVGLPKNGRMPVAVTLNGSGDPFKEMFLRDLNARTFMSGGSILSGKMGEKLFSEDFTLYATRNPEDIYNTSFFDAEGTINKEYRFTLVEDGILKTPYTDKRTAQEYALKNTGSAFAEYDEVPSLVSPNLAIKRGKKTIKELFAGDVGIWVIEAGGGDFTPSGEFASPVQIAFLYDGEKIIGRLPQLQISSHLYKMFNENYRGVSSNSIFEYSNDPLIVMDMDVSTL